MHIFRIQLTRGRVLVAAVLLVLTVCAALGAAMQVPPTYSANADYVLLSGTRDPNGHLTNPFLSFNDSLNVTATVVSSAVSSDSSVNEILGQGGTRHFTIAPAAGNAPMLLVTAAAPTPGQARTTVRLVANRMDRELASRQTQIGAPAGSLVTIMGVTDVSKASRVLKGPIQLGLAVLALGLFVSLVLLFLLDRALTDRSKTRRSGRNGPAHLAKAGLADGVQEPRADGTEVAQLGGTSGPEFIENGGRPSAYVTAGGVDSNSASAGADTAADGPPGEGRLRRPKRVRAPREVVSDVAGAEDGEAVTSEAVGSNLP